MAPKAGRTNRRESIHEVSIARMWAQCVAPAGQTTEHGACVRAVSWKSWRHSKVRAKMGVPADGTPIWGFP